MHVERFVRSFLAFCFLSMYIVHWIDHLIYFIHFALKRYFLCERRKKHWVSMYYNLPFEFHVNISESMSIETFVWRLSFCISTRKLKRKEIVSTYFVYAANEKYLNCQSSYNGCTLHNSIVIQKIWQRVNKTSVTKPKHTTHRHTDTQLFIFRFFATFLYRNFVSLFQFQSFYSELR